MKNKILRGEREKQSFMCGKTMYRMREKIVNLQQEKGNNKSQKIKEDKGQRKNNIKVNIQQWRDENVKVRRKVGESITIS